MKAIDLNNFNILSSTNVFINEANTLTEPLKLYLNKKHIF